jgi:hypothetical protein
VTGRYQSLADDVTIAGDVRPNLSSAVNQKTKRNGPSWNRFASASAPKRSAATAAEPLLICFPSIVGVSPRSAAYFSGRK